MKGTARGQAGGELHLGVSLQHEFLTVGFLPSPPPPTPTPQAMWFYFPTVLLGVN